MPVADLIKRFTKKEYLLDLFPTVFATNYDFATIASYKLKQQEKTIAEHLIYDNMTNLSCCGLLWLLVHSFLLGTRRTGCHRVSLFHHVLKDRNWFFYMTIAIWELAKLFLQRGNSVQEKVNFLIVNTLQIYLKKYNLFKYLL